MVRARVDVGDADYEEPGKHHPFRWRPLTWVIVDLDAFFLGSTLGIILAYNLFVPFSSDSQEAAAIYGVLLVFLALCANGLLGAGWAVTGIVARRRRPKGERLRPHSWLGPPIALLVGVFLAGGWFWSSFGGESTGALGPAPPAPAPNASTGPTTGAGPRATPPGRISWPETQALPTFPRAGHLWVADMLNAPGDQQILFATLQGLVNRQRPRIFLIQDARENEKDGFWLRHLDAPWTVVPSPWELLHRFGHQVRGSIVYDRSVPASINVATTLAGLRGAVVASPSLAERLEANYDLPVLEDLRGRFTDEMESYEWQFERLWPRTTHRMLIAIPGLAHGEPFGMLRDYAVANRAMAYWLDPTDAVQRDLYDRILADVAPNTPFLGWFPQGGVGEWSGVELLSEHGVYTFAADTFQNMTVFSARCCHEKIDPRATPAPPLEDKVYITFTFSDGDNLAYDQGTMRGLWDNPDRGSVPMNWTISPALWDAAPAILRFYRQTATANDLLMAGPSGLGYAYPSPWPDGMFPPFAELSARYMDRAGIDTVWVFNVLGGQMVEMSQADAEAYVDAVDPVGIMLNTVPSSQVQILGGTTPQSTGWPVASVAEAEAAIAELSAWWDHSSPLFLSIYMVAWTTSPSDVVEIADSLGPEYEVVRADHFFELIREAPPAGPAPVRGVTASGSYAGSLPELAVDGDLSTAWNAGAFAPQWIEIDLGEPRSIYGISLLTAQSPKGETVHRILGKTNGADAYRVLHGFAGATIDGQWLRYSPPAPWENLRFLRIETTDSPSWVSWREILIQLEPAA